MGVDKLPAARCAASKLSRAWQAVALTAACGLCALGIAGCAALLQTPIATPTRPPLSAPPLTPRAVVTLAPALTPTVPLTPTAVLLPTATPTAVPPTATPAPTAAVVLLPTVTPTPEPLPTVTVAPATAMPDAGAAWPATYRVQGTFVSQTRFPDATVSSQQGSFTILHQSAANAYGANQAYSLSTLRAGGLIDTSAVFLVDDYIAVTYSQGNWVVVRRDQGSSLVAAIQPITDLAAALLTVADRAAIVDEEPRDGLPTRHIRLTAADELGSELVRPILGLAGDIRDLTLDAWIVAATAESRPYVAAYDFRVEIAGARVFDDQGQETLADQTVSWSYQLLDINTPLTITWPAAAPAPGVVDVPGFARGAFPLPPQTELISVIDGVPALLSLQKEDDLAAFYRTKLTALGWQVEGDTGLLRCSKGETVFQLLISADPAAGGTRVSILPAP